MVPSPVIANTLILSRGNGPPPPPGGPAALARAPRIHSYLTTATTNFSVLFKDAYIGDNGAFALALFLCALFGVLLSLLVQSSRRAEASVLTRHPRPRLKVRAAAALVHGLRMFLIYIAIMVVMTRNLWLVLAMVFGHSLGWLLFSTVVPVPAEEEEERVVDNYYDDDDFEKGQKAKADVA